MKILFCKNYHSDQQKNDLRKKADCLLVDYRNVDKNNGSDNLLINEENYPAQKQPLRIIVTSFNTLDLSWVILNDQMRRNTMIVTFDDEVLVREEVVQELEKRGVALLMCQRLGPNELSFESLVKSLKSLKFQCLLVEGEIELMPSLK